LEIEAKAVTEAIVATATIETTSAIESSSLKKLQNPFTA